jgi:hypothetical protein
MITNDVHPGDLIQFEYVNETTINFRKKVTLDDEHNNTVSETASETAGCDDRGYNTSGD